MSGSDPGEAPAGLAARLGPAWDEDGGGGAAEALLQGRPSGLAGCAAGLPGWGPPSGGDGDGDGTSALAHPRGYGLSPGRAAADAATAVLLLLPPLLLFNGGCGLSSCG